MRINEAEWVTKIRMFLNNGYVRDKIKQVIGNEEVYYVDFPSMTSAVRGLESIARENYGLFRKIFEKAAWDTQAIDLRFFDYPRLLIDLSNVPLSLIRPKEDDTFDMKACFQGKMFLPKPLGDRIMKDFIFKTLKGSDDVYWYNNGVYTKDGKEKIMEQCVSFMGDGFTKHRASEILAYIQSCTYIDPNIVNNNWINLENGLLNPITGEFRKHTPDIFTVTRIPIRYDPNAECPLWKEKLSQKIDEDTMNVIQEMFGYCYLPGQKFERAFLLYGKRKTMKSTTLFVLGKMLGDDNVTAFPLQQLTTDSFAAAYLYGMPANICADLSSAALKDTGMFMTITGGDKITAGKKHQHHISFYPSTKLIFSCNTVPATTNKNLAFYRRWILLKFNRQHDPDEIDPDLKEKLLKELPGILNWSLEGLRRLLKNGDFSYWLDEVGVKDIYERNSDTIQSFIYNEIDTDDDEGVITKREAYAAYVEYCRRLEVTPENVIKFGRMFKAHTGCGTCKKGKIPAYSGVSFKGNSSRQSKLGDNYS